MSQFVPAVKTIRTTNEKAILSMDYIFVSPMKQFVLPMNHTTHKFALPMKKIRAINERYLYPQ